MHHFIKLTDYTSNDIFRIFHIADEIQQGRHTDVLKGKTIVQFFPNSSIRTRVTFEKGIQLLGGQSILFPMETLDKKEAIKDVIGYLNNWADEIIVRYKDLSMLEEIGRYSNVPVINAMTDCNHPCEILSDLYALSKIRDDFTKDHYLYCGRNSNIGYSWKEASEVMGLELTGCCGQGYEMDGVPTYHTIQEAIKGKDVVCTDSLPSNILADFVDCQVTKAVMEQANPGAVLNPCPPFFRGEEVSNDVIDSTYFVGYSFKKHLLEIQQAVLLFCLGAA